MAGRLCGFGEGIAPSRQLPPVSAQPQYRAVEPDHVHSSISQGKGIGGPLGLKPVLPKRKTMLLLPLRSCVLVTPPAKKPTNHRPPESNGRESSNSPKSRTSGPQDNNRKQLGGV